MKTIKKIGIDLFIAITATVIGGFVLAYVLQDAKFDPSRSQLPNPATPTPELSNQNQSSQKPNKAQTDIHEWLFSRVSDPICSTVEICSLYSALLAGGFVLAGSLSTYLIDREKFDFKISVALFLGFSLLGIFVGIGIYYLDWTIGFNRAMGLVMMSLLGILLIREMFTN